MTINKAIITSIISVLLIATLSSCGDEESISSISDDMISQLQQAYGDGTISIDYDSAEDFESALNDGVNATNKIVSFNVSKVSPDSAAGFNVMAGEHLNFISNEERKIKENDQATVLVSNAKSKFGSWFIDYKLIGTKNLALIEESASQISEYEIVNQPKDSIDKTSASEIVDNSTSVDSEEKIVPEPTETNPLTSVEVEATQNITEATAFSAQQSTNTQSKTKKTSEDVVPIPETNSNTSDINSGNADNFDTYDNPEQQQTEATYVLNTSSMKFHYPSCKSVKKIAPKNYATSSASRDELISQGYDPCGNCNP